MLPSRDAKGMDRHVRARAENPRYFPFTFRARRPTVFDDDIICLDDDIISL